MSRPAIGLPDDSVLASMIKGSGYVAGSRFAKDTDLSAEFAPTRFLVVLALPYSGDEATSPFEAIEAALQFMQDVDADERMFTVWDAETGELHENVTVRDLRPDDYEEDDDNTDNEVE